ncbi:MAG: NERD domain-containing protein [Mesorhizobium sp.]
MDREEIIAVEIKSAKDKIDRLPAQVKAMKGVAHYVIAALHEKFLVPAKWAEGRVEAPPEAKDATVWAYPEAGAEAGRTYGCSAWEPLRLTLCKALPTDAVRMLWHDELYRLCGQFHVSVGRRATNGEMARVLRWHCNGKELTRGVCAALRARSCIEADPEIIERIAA